MASASWREKFSSARVMHLTQVLSGHCALWVEWVVNASEEKGQRRKKRFWFETLWLEVR